MRKEERKKKIKHVFYPLMYIVLNFGVQRYMQSRGNKY